MSNYEERFECQPSATPEQLAQQQYDTHCVTYYALLKDLQNLRDTIQRLGARTDLLDPVAAGRLSAMAAVLGNESEGWSVIGRVVSQGKHKMGELYERIEDARRNTGLGQLPSPTGHTHTTFPEAPRRYSYRKGDST